MKKWKTADGQRIRYKDLKDRHLANILKFIKRKAVEGVLIQAGGGVDADDMWYDEYLIFGEEVLEMLDYKGLLEESVRRDHEERDA